MSKVEYSDDLKKYGRKYPFFEFNKLLVITRDDGLPYLIRRTLISIGKWFSIKIHDIVKSDDECLHDHPWPFISIVLKGGYYEWSYAKGLVDIANCGGFTRAKDGRWIIKKWYGPGSILFRPAKWAHRLELKTKVVDIVERANNGMYYPTYIDQTVPCRTLVFTFRVQRQWGFFTKLGWKYWRDYNKKEHC